MSGRKVVDGQKQKKVTVESIITYRCFVQNLKRLIIRVKGRKLSQTRTEIGVRCAVVESKFHPGFFRLIFKRDRYKLRGLRFYEFGRTNAVALFETLVQRNSAPGIDTQYDRHLDLYRRRTCTSPYIVSRR